MKKKGQKILMVFIEPTPYILGLINALHIVWLGQIDIIFLKSNFSQQWNLKMGENVMILPGSRLAIIKIFFRIFFKEKYSLFFLAGWSNFVCLFIMFIAKLIGIPSAVDSDTPLSPMTALWKRIVKRMVYPTLFKFPSIFLPAGTRQAAYLKYYGVSPDKIVIEKMTVDVTGMQQSIQALPSDIISRIRMDLSIDSQDSVFLFVGRLIERKGIVQLLQVFSALNNNTIKLVIVGDGPLKGNVEGIAAMNPNIHYVGWLEKDALLAMYCMADVFVFPAHFEPWGLVINEAMAAGKPVIVSDQVGCVDDLVVEKKTGLIIASRDHAALSDAVQWLAESVDRRVEMSDNAMALISTWTLENEALIMCEVWHKLLLRH